MALNLREFRARDHSRESARIEAKDKRPEILQIAQIRWSDIGEPVLGESVEKHRPISAAIGNDRPKSLTPSLTRPRHALLDKPAPQIRVNEADAGSPNGLAQRRIRDTFLALEAPEGLRRKHAHGSFLPHEDI
jgi:hypothetical protein